MLQAGTWNRVLQMSPGEEQQVEVPIDRASGASLLRIEAGSGFRPSEREPASRDQRFLGVWVKVDSSTIRLTCGLEAAGSLMAGPERAKRVEGGQNGPPHRNRALHLHLAGILFDLVEHAEPSKPPCTPM